MSAYSVPYRADSDKSASNTTGKENLLAVGFCLVWFCCLTGGDWAYERERKERAEQALLTQHCLSLPWPLESSRLSLYSCHLGGMPLSCPLMPPPLFLVVASWPLPLLYTPVICVVFSYVLFLLCLWLISLQWIRADHWLFTGYREHSILKFSGRQGSFGTSLYDVAVLQSKLLLYPSMILVDYEETL